MSDRMRVLIADDIQLARQNLKELLEREGIEIVEAENEEQAKNVLQDNFDIIILDLAIPKIENGFNVLRHIKQLNNKPIVIISSGISTSKTVAQAVCLGADCYLVKPNTDKIIDWIREYKKTTA
jgi:two-component system, OmpR family, response regulator